MFRILCTFAALGVSACSFGPERSVARAVKGQVFEVTNPYATRSAWHLVPLADAEVLVTWNAELDAFADSQRACVRAAFVKSAADGSFSLPEAVTGFSGSTAVATSHAYKDGYVDVHVTAASAEFGSSGDHVKILRKVDDASLLPDRERQFSAAANCPAK